MGITETLLFLGIVAFWAFIARAVGISAARKNRRRWLWTLLAVFPLGPIVGPLWLITMPIAGVKASTAQILGRSALILVIVASQLFRVVQTVNENVTLKKASSQFGYEVQTKVTPYRHMNLDEIAACIQLAATIKDMVKQSTINEDGDTYLFETGLEVDLFNSANELNAEMECDDRTYDIADLDKAMTLIDEGSAVLIETSLLERINSIDFKIAKWNSETPAMVDESTRLNSVRHENDYEIVTEFTLVEYSATEVSQADLSTYFKPTLRSGACNDADLSKLLREGYLLTYNYWGKDDRLIGTVKIHSCGE